jgi:hypothetical protein
MRIQPFFWLSALAALLLLGGCIPYNRDPELDAALEKLYVISDQLHASINAFQQQQDDLEGRLRDLQQAEQSPYATQALAKCQLLRQSTDQIYTVLRAMRQNIIEVSGGLNQQGRLVGGHDHQYQEAYTLGHEQNGAAYMLEERLLAYADTLRQIDPGLPLPQIVGLAVAHTAPIAMDFSTYYFSDAPTISCLLSLSSMEWEIARNALEATRYLARQAAH